MSSEASDGARRTSDTIGAGEPVGSTRTCVHSKGEPSEAGECKFCGEKETRQVSRMPKCFSCDVELFIPNQKICHECGAKQVATNPQQQPTPPRLNAGLQDSPSRAAAALADQQTNVSAKEFSISVGSSTGHLKAVGTPPTSSTGEGGEKSSRKDPKRQSRDELGQNAVKSAGVQLPKTHEPPKEVPGTPPEESQTSQPQGDLYSKHSEGESNQEGTPIDGTAAAKVPGKPPSCAQGPRNQEGSPRNGTAAESPPKVPGKPPICAQTSQPQRDLFSQHSKGEGNQEGTPSDGRGASAPSKVPGKAPGSTQDVGDPVSQKTTTPGAPPGGKTVSTSSSHTAERRPPRNPLAPGLNAPPGKSVAVTFHVVLPKSAWGWRADMKMYIQFGHKQLGSWNYNCGPLHQKRELSSDLCEMVGTFRINEKLLDCNIPYKYVVCSTERVNDVLVCKYEFLHHYSNRFRVVNRCFAVKLDYCYGGAYDQYDTIAYPEDPGKVPGITTLQENDHQETMHFDLPAMEEMCITCLEFYLQDYYMLLTDLERPMDRDIDQLGKGMDLIFLSLYCPLTIRWWNSVDKKPQSRLHQHMKMWLETAVEQLMKQKENRQGRRLQSALAIAYYLNMFQPSDPKQKDVLVPLLEMLQLHVDSDSKTCPGYTSVKAVVPPEHREEAAMAIRGLISTLSNEVRSKNLGWLSAIPLYHFLSGKSQPFQRLEMNPHKIKWDEKERELLKLMTTIRKWSKPGQVVQKLQELQPLMQADPLLLLYLVYICPLADYPKLFPHIPAFLAITWLSHKAKTENRSIPVFDADLWMGWIIQIRTGITEPVQDSDVREVCVSTLDAAVLLCYNLSGRLDAQHDYHIELMKCSYTLALFALNHLHTHVPEDERVQKGLALQELTNILKVWVARPEVIGGSLFGYRANQKQWKAEAEIKLWNSLLRLECPGGTQVSDQWQISIRSLIQNRANEVPFRLRLELIRLLERCDDAHPDLTAVLMEAAMDAIVKLYSQPTMHKAKELEELAASHSKLMGQVLGTLLKKKYPQWSSDKDDLTLDDLLNWHYWPAFIRIHVGSLTVKEGMPDECLQFCVRAACVLGALSHQLHNGQIPMRELQKVVRKKEQMKSLCQAAFMDGEQVEKGELPLKAVEQTLTSRMEEFEAFYQRREYLVHLCDHIPDSVQGLKQLKQELGKDYNDYEIGKLCVRRNGKVEFPCFALAAPLCFAKSFHVMTRERPSELFLEHWRKRAQLETGNKEVSTLADMSQVWTEAFQACRDLLKDIQDQTIRLVNVNECLRPHYMNLETQLMNLHHGVHLCSDIPDNDLSTGDRELRSAVGRIRSYWELWKYYETADAFLKIREVLHLSKGDFKYVEDLSRKVNFITKDQTLGSVTDELIETGDSLKKVAVEELECLVAFARCQNVTVWLKEVTKDVNDLQNFVNVALATASGGEDDFTHDKLSNLRAVGSAFGSLIYKLPEDAGYKEVSAACTTIWGALRNNPKLTAMLEDCSKDLEWYKAVKKTQGSVEVTSYGQMENILMFGQYSVGAGVGQTIVHGIHEVIRLKLDDRSKQLTKTTYTLDELRDLESKLVLITGSEAKNREKVDQFFNTLHSVCRIAEVLIALQQAGNVKYSGWRMDFLCKVDMVDELQEQAKKMELELEEWMTTVRECRDLFYELNSYTTIQLLALREALGKLQDPTQCSTTVDPTVLVLLQSISLKVTAEDVRGILRLVSEELKSGAGRETQDVGSSRSTSSLQQSHQIEEPSVDLAELVVHVPEYTATPPCQPKAMPCLGGSSALTVTPLDETASKRKMAEKDLNQEQKQTYAQMVDYFGFDPQLVLKALQVCDDQYEVKEWCSNHADEFEVSDVEEDKAVENEHREPFCSDQEAGEPVPPENDETVEKKPAMPTLPSGSTAKVSVTTPQPTTQFPPVVLDLIDAGYSKEQAMEAVEKCGTEVLPCMDYLMAQDGEVEDLQASLPVEPDQLEPLIANGSMTPMRVQSCEDKLVIHQDEQAGSHYLSLTELGKVLKELRHTLSPDVHECRKFPKALKPGACNLVVTSAEMVLKTTLSLFMEDKLNTLPTLEEILICSENTTAEEVTLLWRRAVGDPQFKRIFCLVHAEKMSYKECDKALHSLNSLTQGKPVAYRLVIICSGEDEEKSYIISKLHNDRRQYKAPTEIKPYQEYLKLHYRRELSDDTQHGLGLNAAQVDHERFCVRIVSSTRSGMGKTLYITRMADRLRALNGSSVTVPLHGPVITPDAVMEFLKEHTISSTSTIFHIDIAPTVLYKVDTILFSLLILGGLIDSQGRVWRSHPTQLYVVEATLPGVEEWRDISEGCTLSLLKLLPAVDCCSPRKAMELMKTGCDDPSAAVMDKREFESAAYQRVYQYLRRHFLQSDLDMFSYCPGNVEGNCIKCLEILLRSCGIKDPSWSEVCHFVSFLDVQLQSCEQSVFCNRSATKDALPGFKDFVVRFMIRMSMDFATSSLRGEVAKENDESIQLKEGLEEYQISERRRWEESSHPYIFFNQDRTTVTFMGFKVTQGGNLIDPRNGHMLEAGIVSQKLYDDLKLNRVNFDEDFLSWPKHVMIEKIATVMGIDFPYDPDESYVLTVDNVIKILAIHMRIRCGIPVVIIGETGCGKTRLIRYMCDMARQGKEAKNMFIMKVHGGTTEQDVIDLVHRAEKESLENMMKGIEDTVVFFDEANTTDAIGLIKEIMCDRRLRGKEISRNIKFIAACNPYRKHTKQMIEKLESAGLGFYVKATETEQKLGKVPLRQLVYRVLDLPPSMRPLAFDFGLLSISAEKDYTSQIVANHVKNHQQLSKIGDGVVVKVARVLAWSQWFMKQREDECSFVSLRDVERSMIVFEYFYEKMAGLFRPRIDAKAKAEGAQGSEVDDITRCLLLAVSVCYQARLQDRRDYEEGVSKQLEIHGGADRFRSEIRWCQDVLLDSMELGHNIARNAALRENIFMMAVCIELRIPLFLVGKPGSSKSLAKSVVASSMHGEASNREFLRHFKQVHMFSYQCSQLSTPESVIEVFNTAKRFQKDEDTTKYVSVVVLDEVGLAEDSPNLPLKALHPLLEDGTEGADDSDQIVEREKRVAFLGLSNWALDPAKMNRGIMVARSDPDVEELVLSAKGICSDKENDPIKMRMEPYIEHLAEAYISVCKKQTRDFFGLRDFYSLIKMLYWMCERSGMSPTWIQLQHAILRNFGGLEEKNLNPMEEFASRIHSKTAPDLTNTSDELKPILSPDCTKLGLIETSLRTKETSWHGENRYLLFLTESYTALEILRHYLSGVVTSSSCVASAFTSSVDVDTDHEGVTSASTRSVDVDTNHEGVTSASTRSVDVDTDHEGVTSASTRSVDVDTDHEGVTDPKSMEPFILFGSSFPRDREYTQVCRNINQIKICMETGRTVILLNLENLYESLYDVLNQYYIYYGGSRYVDLGLQTHKVKCRVHDSFKLILIAERDTVYGKFPTPLINRLEKHFILASSALLDWQLDVLTEFEEWIHTFSYVEQTGDRPFKESDAFIGFQKDTPAAVVFQATNHLKSLQSGSSGTATCSRAAAHLPIFGVTSSEELTHEVGDSERLKDGVLQLSQILLLRTASPDAVIRLERTPLREQAEQLSRIYFVEQGHSSLKDFLEQQLSGDTQEGGILMQVTTHSHLLTRDEINELGQGKTWQIFSFQLQEFDTELDFSNKVGPVFQMNPGDTGNHLLIIQCDSGYVDSDLIACARYRIYDQRAKKKKGITPGTEGVTHVLFIIHMPRYTATSSSVGYWGDPWISAHIDDMRNPSKANVMLFEALRSSISGMFLSMSKCKVHVVPEAVEGKEKTSKNATETAEQLVHLTELHGQTELVLPRTFKPSKVVEATGYYQQLHCCIQAAASKLQGLEMHKARSIDLVEILVGLVPRIAALPLDPSCFHGILVEHIHRLLEERDEIRADEAAWVLTEALDPKKLQNGGTFRNCLARKLNDVIVPIFTALIARMDRYYNMNLIRKERDNSPVAQLWLAMFRDPQMMRFRYEDLVLPGVERRMLEDEFECQFPFSWLIREEVEAQWDNAKSTTSGTDLQSLRIQLHTLISENPMCRALDGVSEDYIEEFCAYYIHDYVESVHKSNHRESKYRILECQLICDALGNMVAHSPAFGFVDGQHSLSSRLAAVHVVYQSNKTKILWFGQLAYQMPGILESFQHTAPPSDSSEMLLHLCAVERALAILEPPLKKDEETMIQWLNNIRISQNTVDSILSLPSETDLGRRTRLQWQLIRALQLFVEHILLKYRTVEGMIQGARRLHLCLESDSDFLKASTVERVRKHLNGMDKQLAKAKVEELKEIRQSCGNFFMELVSTLCYGRHTAPEPDLALVLLDTVFTENQETKEFSYKDAKTDQVPVVRSFILQLLLEHNTVQVKGHLDEYFRRSSHVLSQEIDQGLCLLCIQCFEDALCKQHADKPLQEQAIFATQIIGQGHQALQQYATERTMSIDYLEGVAQVRYSLSVVAELLNRHKDGSQAGSQSHDEQGAFVRQLLPAAKDACTDPAINHTSTSGPVVYLLKLLVRRYGTHCLQNVVNTPTLSCSWVMPRNIRTSEEDQQATDPFVIYNSPYTSLRDCMYTAVYGQDLTDLKEASKELEPKHVPLVLLALYEIATLSRGSSNKQVDPDVWEQMDKFIQESRIFTKEMRWIARALLANHQGGTLAQLTISPQQPPLQRTLGAIVVHAVVVFQSLHRLELIQPFLTMLNSPSAVKKAYLPTMPEDSLPEVRQVLASRGGAFYECPRGHTYYVDRCGRPTMEYTCPTCGDRIGGKEHILLSDNKAARRDNRSQTGHCLGPPDLRGGVPTPERALSPSACCIVRGLMHSALLWASCNNDGATQGLCELVKPDVMAPHLPEFFWVHLEKDLELLAKATGKSVDEAAVLMHLVLKHIADVVPSRYVATTVTSLRDGDARKEWEGIFNESYLQPLLMDIEDALSKAMQSILNDVKGEHDMLFLLVYECVEVESGIEPHLWTYRPRMALDHLGITLQQKDFKQKHPILHEFLQQEHRLRATQYLPAIVRLQQQLCDRFNHQLDRKEARSITITNFLESIKTENIRNEYAQLIGSFKKAWSLVGSLLGHHARLHVEDQYLICAVTDDTPIEFLIPTLTDAGACSTALADFLMLTHNSFIERCMGIVTDREKSKILWYRHEVPITHVRECHLLDYEHQLLPIVLAHCHYSLTVGQGEKIVYDLPGLEKHILNRFIHGKPLIVSKVPQMAYKKDVYTAATFVAVRKNVDPQTPIPARLQQELLHELHTVDRLRGTLDIVDIVMGFLSTGGGNPNRLLGAYVKDTLKIEKPYCEKAKERCTLGNILSLWETLSVELARQLTLSGQEPFDCVKPEFKEELEAEEKKALHKSLRLADLRKLLGALYEFIETYAKHSPPNEKDWPLASTLEFFLERNGLPKVPNLADFLPDTVTMGKAVATWKYIVEFQERQKQE